jgi:hypothetical protein
VAAGYNFRAGVSPLLFTCFHRLVEIRESGQMKTNNHSNGKTLPDLKRFTERVASSPANDCEPLTVWDEVFS